MLYTTMYCTHVLPVIKNLLRHRSIGRLTDTHILYYFLAFDSLCQLRGGAVGNFGGVVTFNAGSLFLSNHASSSGDGGLGGAVYNGDDGDIT